MLDCRGDEITLLWVDHLDFTFLDESEQPRIIRIPFSENVPDVSQADYYVEFGYASVRTGLLTLGSSPRDEGRTALTHLLAVGIGVFLMWAFRRRGTHPVITHLDPRLM